MDVVTARLALIASDHKNALETLARILAHIDDTKPAPDLRVVMLNNTIVGLTAANEETLRGLFQEYLTVLEEHISGYAALPVALQKSNLASALGEMRKLNRDGDFKAIAQIVGRLDTCLTGKPNYQLMKEQITYNEGNFRSKQLTEIAKNVGLDKLWYRMCDCGEVEEYTAESAMDARVTRLTTKWNDLFEERDLVVHQISQASGWGADLIKQALALSELVVGRVAACLANDGNELIRIEGHGAGAGPGAQGV